MTEERIERFFCNACKQKTKHFIRGEYNKHDGDAAYWYKHRMLIIECCGCENLELVKMTLFFGAHKNVKMIYFTSDS